MVENNSTTFRCNICNKNYKDKSGLWYHNNKYHNNTDNTFNNTSYDNNQIKVIKNTFDNTFDNTLNDDNQILDKNHDSKYKCKKCNKNFKNYQNRWKHEKICKATEENVNLLIEKNILLENTIKQQLNEIVQIKQAIDEQKKMFEEQIIEMKKQLVETMNKKCKVHPKTLQKINKQLINDNKNINNGTVNNTYNIIGLGHENLDQVFTRKEKMAILKNRFYCLPELVEYTHFNDKYPQFKNILITNTQNTLAYKYDTKKNQFMAVNKDELLEDIVDARICDISSFYEELENDLDQRTKEIIEKVIDKIENDPAYKEIKKKDIKLIIYNNRKKVIKDNLLEDEIEV
jgi:hypothetical protein